MKKTSRFSLSMSPELHEKATGKAEKMDTPLGRVVRQLLREWVAEKLDVEVELL